MKKMVAVILAVLCLVSLVACGKNNDVSNSTNEESSLDKADSSNYIGKWQTEEDYYIQIEKGGTASYRPVETPDKGVYSMKWELVDDVIALDYESSVLNTRITLELNEDGSALEQVGGDFPVRKTDRATFVKVD